jgi:protease-4
MGAAAASAAYYISAPATRIYANPLTITGSIGVFYGKADVSELLRRIGVSVEVYKTAPRADAESLYRPFTDEEKVELQRKVGQFYAQFLSRVSAGRKLTTAQVDAVGQGQVWTGEQALSRKLVDELGGLRQALNQARLLGDLPDYAPIIELPPPESTLLGRVLGVEGLHADATQGISLPPELLSLAQALAPFVIHPADKPMARLEITDIGP